MRRFLFNALRLLSHVPFLGHGLAIIALCSTGALAGALTAQGLRGVHALARRVPVSTVPASIDERYGADAAIGYVIGAAPIAVMGLVIFIVARWLAGDQPMPRLLFVPWDWWGVLIVVWAVVIVLAGVIMPETGAWMTSDGPAWCFFELTMDCLKPDDR